MSIVVETKRNIICTSVQLNNFFVRLSVVPANLWNYIEFDWNFTDR